jgi:type II secretory pathway component PulF
MDKYIVKYTDKKGDLTSVWVHADSNEDAKRQVKQEYWDVVDIVMVYKG